MTQSLRNCIEVRTIVFGNISGLSTTRKHCPERLRVVNRTTGLWTRNVFVTLGLLCQQRFRVPTIVNSENGRVDISVFLGSVHSRLSV